MEQRQHFNLIMATPADTRWGRTSVRDFARLRCPCVTSPPGGDGMSCSPAFHPCRWPSYGPSILNCSQLHWPAALEGS